MLQRSQFTQEYKIKYLYPTDEDIGRHSRHTRVPPSRNWAYPPTAIWTMSHRRRTANDWGPTAGEVSGIHVYETFVIELRAEDLLADRWSKMSPRGITCPSRMPQK
ncbi:Hypothetical protein NTJ_08964 [Nesidiocoris tenuis]|uniref:Uncharacterized protein n=1 Tax=Nesidiocoris tenuis TaxID=355587 RepID=A0ABN7AXA4_9HEMI|nr:Hypothetical protein NTJ_08964 [Nesidiocoris tenuis]